MTLLIDFCFLSAVSLLSRGWIVPVGGSTPDRHKARPARPAQGSAQGPARELILIFRLLSNACAGVDRSGRGCNPRPAQGATGSAGSRISARTGARIDSHFPALIQCLRGGGSFRSGVQPPTGIRPDRLAGSRINARTSARIDSHFPALIQCLRGGGSFRSGVQPPTGSNRPAQGPTGSPAQGSAQGPA